MFFLKKNSHFRYFCDFYGYSSKPTHIILQTGIYHAPIIIKKFCPKGHNHDNYYYNVMPFWLKNASATYHRLVDVVFSKQIGLNLEVSIKVLVH